MKLIFTALIIGSTLTAVGQQCQQPNIPQQYHAGGNTENATWFGNTTFYGSGQINSSAMVFNYTAIKYDGNEGLMSVYAPFNAVQQNQSLYLAGNIEYHAGISLSGQNNSVTILNSGIKLYNIVGNNTYNYMYIKPIDSVWVNGIYYKAGMTIPGANASNNIPILSCFGTTLNTGIISFTESNGELKWQVSGNKPITVEYRPLEVNTWQRVYSGTETTYKCERTGLYRIVYDGETSKVIKVVVRETGAEFAGAKRAYFNGTVLIFQPKNK